MPRVIAEVLVWPSEDRNKVIQALNNVFEYDELTEEREGYAVKLIAVSNSLKGLQKLHKMLREERILDSARKHLLNGLESDKLVFMLNKQVAFVGKVVFADSDRESPLGPIKITVESKNPLAVVDWLAPKTAKGVPLWENPMPNE
ncbi:MAG: hypothetical protein L7H21_02465 [Sulfolobales archaeon]|nr:hypothetical protein [Sulfolobales archaeon]MCG2893438.1 hypothetical protein [Sulfolobales archaeon]MCG2910493.1 hypothetical protein [Sulfolobales archaeon]